ncbi:MAG TPA: phosphotransferase [Amycolatopsis sp.]|nr:phosphotransferase [Amycolatopsis sp.]
MTSTVRAEPAQWYGLLPGGRRFVTLPSRRRPVVIAEANPAVLRYVRTALLTVPPGSSLPGWVFAAARHALRLPVLWRIAPHVDAPPGRDRPHFERLVPGGRLLLLRHSRDPDARLLLLVFAPGERTPRYAVKVPTEPAGAARVARESARLREIGALPLGPVRATVPCVVPGTGMPALVTTAAAGTPMLVGYHRHGHTRRPATVRADLSAAGDWLAAFQTATVGPSAPLDVAPAVPDLLRQRPDSGRLLSQLDRLRERLRRHHAPRTAVHGDFWPGNLLVEHGAVSGVVDWEWAEPAGSPVRDLARFVLAYSHYLDRHSRPGRPVRGHPGLHAGRPGAALSYALQSNGWYPRLVRHFLHTGLHRLGLPPACARDAVLAELVAIAAEATDDAFAEHQLRAFERLAAEVPS